MSTSSGGKSSWQLAFQQTPILLSNGLASFMPGGMLPLIAITEAINFPLGLLGGGGGFNLDSFFANFQPMPGGTLISQDLGRYPFANQQVAANATIQQPLRITMRMLTLARENLGYLEKLTIMTALQAALDQHNQSGGTYIVATPSFIYVNCVLLELRDVSTLETKQPQNAWEFIFEKPLLTLDQAQAAQNSLFSRITAGLGTAAGSVWTGVANTIGIPATLAGQVLSPIVAGTAGAVGGGITVSPLPPLPGTVASGPSLPL